MISNTIDDGGTVDGFDYGMGILLPNTKVVHRQGTDLPRVGFIQEGVKRCATKCRAGSMLVMLLISNVRQMETAICPTVLRKAYLLIFVLLQESMCYLIKISFRTKGYQ